MARAIVECESTLTDSYQTTVPEIVRKALHLQKRDTIHYTVLSDGSVMISRAGIEAPDPVIGKFLDFLANDIAQNPHHLTFVDESLVSRIQSLVADKEIDLNAALSDKDD